MNSVHSLVCAVPLLCAACGGTAILGTEPRDSGAPKGASNDAAARDNVEAGTTGELDGGHGVTLSTGGGDAGYEVVTIWTGPSAPEFSEGAFDIAANADHVYFTNTVVVEDGGAEVSSVMSVPVNGGTATTFSADDTSTVGLTLDSTNVYWLNYSGDVNKAPLGGGAPTTLASGLALYDEYALGLTVDSGDVYFPVGSANASNIFDTLGIGRMPTSGGSVVTLAHAPMLGESPPIGGGIALDDTNVYWEAVPSVGGFDGCGGDCFIHTYEAQILSAPRGGGAITTLATTTPATTGQLYTTSIAVDSSNVYFTSDGALVSVPIGGGKVTTIASSPPMTAGFVFDGESFYWTSQNNGPGGVVAKVRKDGGDVTTLLSLSSASVYSCAVYGSDLYVFYAVAGDAGTDNAEGFIVKVSPR